MWALDAGRGVCGGSLGKLFAIEGLQTTDIDQLEAGGARKNCFHCHSAKTCRAIQAPPGGTPVALRSEALVLLQPCARLPSLHLPVSVPGRKTSHGLQKQ